MESIKEDILIQKFLDKSLSEKEVKEFRNKIDSDPLFYEKVKEYSELAISLKASDKLIQHSNIKVLYINRLLVAASILLVLGLSTIIIINYTNNKINLAEETYKNIVKEVPAGLLKTESFQPNPVLDKNLELTYRSDALNFNVISPVSSSVYIESDVIDFDIKGQIFSGYYIIIYNNKLEVNYKSPKLRCNAHTFENDLTPGIYYWKVQGRNVTFWAGSFYILPK